MSTKGKVQEITAEDQAGINLIKAVIGMGFPGLELKQKGFDLSVHVDKELTKEQILFLAACVSDTPGMGLKCKRSGPGITVVIELAGMR